MFINKTDKSFHDGYKYGMLYFASEPQQENQWQ